MLQQCLIVFCRYGRVPKPTKPLTYPAKEDAHSSASETTPDSPAGSTAPAVKPKPKYRAKRERSSKQQSAQESKKPKLVTLRASQSEYSDEENEKQWEEEEVEEEQYPSCSSSKDSIAPVFVPASLRSPPPVISEVEETMEEVKNLFPHYVLHRPFILFLHNFYNKHFVFFAFVFSLCMVLHSIIQTLHSGSPHPTRSLISWPICLMCWASPKMHCALMPLASRHKMTQLNPVNISWTYWL